MKRKVYVAGRMRGLPYYNFPAFDEARDRLAGLGLTPLSPADMDRAAGFDPFEMFDEHLVSLAADGGPSCWATVPPSFDLAAAIARDNAAIDDPDTAAVYVIHEGISESAGGMPEIERGMKRGLVILYDTMSDGDILRALGMPVEPQTPPVNPNTTEACRNARAMVMMQEGVKANDPCATVFGKAGAAAMRAHIEKSLVDADRAKAVFPDLIGAGPMSGKTAFAEPLVAHVTRVHEQLEKVRREERESEAAWMRGVTRGNSVPDYLASSSTDLRYANKVGAADKNTAQTFFTDPVTGGRKGGHTEQCAFMQDGRDGFDNPRECDCGAALSKFMERQGGRKGAFASLTAEQKADVLAGKEIRVTDPVTGAHTSMRLARFDLIPQDILWEFAEVYGVGAVKHGDSNMEGGYPWSWSYQKAQRHLSRFWQGEDMDTETRILHVLQAAWHCFTMAWFLRHNAGTDDRPVTGKKGDTHE